MKAKPHGLPDNATIPPAVAVVMGVSGSGKTLIGSALAARTGGRFIDGDHYHPAENIGRMRSGLPLGDEHRWKWLDAIAAEIAAVERGMLVVGCSALKRIYRDRLRRARPHVLFIHLDIGRATAAARVAARQDHFMPASLIGSQFADLEPPAPDERAMTLDATLEPAVLVELATCALLAMRDDVVPG
jgi:gluconokinase